MSSPPRTVAHLPADTDGSGPGKRGPSPLGVLGLVLLLAGVGCLGYVVYQLFGSTVVSRHAYTSEVNQLHNRWQQPSAGTQQQEALPGDAIALLRIPRFGASYQVPVLEGTDLDTLAKGVGHYSGTAMPGQIGNFAVAGHRITHGQPFAQLEQLQQGDTVIVETRTAVYTYRISTAPNTLTVADTASWVLDPVPHQPDATPTVAMITLTTCQDLFHSPDRSVGFGTLVDTRQK